VAPTALQRRFAADPETGAKPLIPIHQWLRASSTWLGSQRRDLAGGGSGTLLSVGDRGASWQRIPVGPSSPPSFTESLHRQRQ